jgi:hypothetical protein
VDITSEKERPTDFPRTVKVGVAEGDTCGPRALTVRTLSTDTMDEAGPLGRPGSASVFPPTGCFNEAEPSRCGRPGVGKWVAPRASV